MVKLLGNVQVLVFCSSLLMNSERTSPESPGTIGVDIGTSHQPRRPSCTPFKREIPPVSLGNSIQHTYKSRFERNLDEQTIKVPSGTSSVGDIDRTQTYG